MRQAEISEDVSTDVASLFRCHICNSLILEATKYTKIIDRLQYPKYMAKDITKIAQKMVQAARAGLAIEKKRLQEIIAERQKKAAPSSR